MWKLFTYGKIFTHGKIKSGRKLTKKKQKQKKKTEKKRFKEERKSTILSRKEKILYEATGTGGALRWRPDFEQRSRRQT